MDVVNLRLMFDVAGPAEGDLEESLTALAELSKHFERKLNVSNR